MNTKNNIFLHVILICSLVVVVFTQNNNEIATDDQPTLKVIIIEREVVFQINNNANITVAIQGNVTEKTTLSFYAIKTFSLINNLSSITIDPGEVNTTKIVTLVPKHVGHCTLYLKATPSNMADVSQAFTVLDISHSKLIDTVSDVVGWIYFLAWSVSFYPQVYLNWKRKSVIGLHFDFLALNTLGFLLYSLFNIGLYWVPFIIEEYFEKHKFGLNPVQLNDVIFSIHAFLACAIQVIQCMIYEKGSQRVSKTARIIIGILFIIIVISLISSVAKALLWLNFLNILSYIKLFITLIKYIPQVN